MMAATMKKQLWSLAHLILLGVGFVLTCCGVYLISQQAEFGYAWSTIPAYIMIVFGVLAVFIGVFWTIFHSMKSKLYHRGIHQQHIQVYSIERPSSFPPSYEESQNSQVFPDSAPELVVVTDGVEMVINLAPPLYSRDSSAPPDCTWSFERPPQYSQVVSIQVGELGAPAQREASSSPLEAKKN